MVLQECPRRHGTLPWTTPTRLTSCSPYRHYNRISFSLNHRKQFTINRAWLCSTSSSHNSNTIKWALIRPHMGNNSYRDRTKQVWLLSSTISNPSHHLKSLGLLKSKAAQCTHTSRMPLWLLTLSTLLPYLIIWSEIRWIIVMKTYSLITNRLNYRIRIDRLMNNSQFLLIINSYLATSPERHLNIINRIKPHNLENWRLLLLRPFPSVPSHIAPI